MTEREREREGRRRGISKEKLKCHLLPTFLLDSYFGLESAERIWQPLNPVLSDEEHCVVSALLTSDNCQLVLQLSPFRAADNTVCLL